MAWADASKTRIPIVLKCMSMLQAEETPEAWESMLLGLAALFKGLASEPSLDELGRAGQEHYLAEEQLQLLLDRSASADARSAVLSIAAAQSGSQASADIQSRQAILALQILLIYSADGENIPMVNCCPVRHAHSRLINNTLDVHEERQPCLEIARQCHSLLRVMSCH